MSEGSLPDYRDPPVDEIVAAVQFGPMVSFRLPEIVRLDRALEGWTLVDAREALEPIVENPPGGFATGRFGIGFGVPPQRAIFTSGEGRWSLQVQHDRVALGEVRLGDRPSSRHVLPELRSLMERIAAALDPGASLVAAGRAELVELIYLNRFDAARGFGGWGRLGELLVGVGTSPGRSRLSEPEGMQVGWAFALNDDDGFVGRLRAEVGPSPDGNAQFQLNSRRYVRGSDPFDVLERCHEDIVRGFDDMTTAEAHKHWGKIR